jgi:BirA family biotin operon repressor/biotin-[acetyl-CoA-carboxylase] ligase
LLNIDLIRSCLIGKTFVGEICYLEEMNSTNDRAKESAGDNLLVLTDFQTKGKGRYGRVWESERGSNVTLSIKKKFDVEPGDESLINFYFSYFVYDTIRELLNEHNVNTSPLNIKWPNDILYEGKKISGLLIESTHGKNEYVTGIGINVNQETFIPEYNAVSLSGIVNRKLDTTSLIIRLIENIDKNLGSLSTSVDDLFVKWKSANNLIGKSVIFNSGSILNKYGNVIDLQRNGGIKLLINGKESTFYSGEIKITLIGS